MAISSAKTRSDLMGQSEMSVYTLNKKGLSMPPWGTPGQDTLSPSTAGESCSGDTVEEPEAY